MAQKPKEVAVKEPVKLTISQVQEELKQGNDRRAIAKKYGLTLSDVKEMFKHPKLAGLRVRPTNGFILEDDTEGEEAKGEAKVSTDATVSSAPATTENAPEASAAPAPQAEAAPASTAKDVW